MMPISEQLLSVLACPQSGKALIQEDGQLATEDNAFHYPIINGLPWLFRNPLHSMVDWSVKLNQFNQILGDEIRQLGNEMKKAPTVTHDRLQRMLAGKKAFQTTVTELVSPILSAKVASKPIYDALSDRAPLTQNLLSYEANLYRDWVWGDEENELSKNILLEHLNQDPCQNLLVLGAGSCRLALDLHQSIKPAITVANDINPFLLFAAQQLFSGKALDVVEFPAHPRNAQSVAVSHHIPALEQWPDDFYLAFSDAATPAFQRGAFDTLVTPWLIDIQPNELVTFMQCLNYYLAKGSHWVNFGSLVFNQKRDAFCYTIEEIEELALQAGFRIESVKEHEIPYLKSPYNAGYRMEKVWSWRAVKVKDVELPQDLQNLPHWILDTDRVIPPTKEIQNFAFSHRMYAELAAKIDGTKSIKQISRKIAREKSMDEQEALVMVKNFYLKIVQQVI
jgi:uncharacterized protein YbaR (Trm112 family)